jgi:predicted Zn-dependent peptidase
MGSAHYLEHLLFKGTRRREALEISSLVDAVGGEMNAFTSKEHTCYYARVLDKDLPLAIDVICDIVTGALLRAEDVDAERGVVLEEIAMRDDDPSDLVHDEFMLGMFGQTDLGRSILGTQETIEGITRDAIASFYQARYRPEAMVVTAAGGLDHDEVVRLVAAAFESAGALRDTTVRPMPARRDGAAVPTSGGLRLVPRPTEQAHLVVGVPGVPRADRRRYTLNILSTALGGGMSSRLFQEIRERRGLAYSVYAFSSGFSDAGVFGAYAGCLPNKVDHVLELALATLEDVARNGLTEEELARGKGQARGSIVLGLEDSGSRMSRLGTADLVLGELPSIDETLARIDAVSLDDVAREAAALLSAPRALTVIGPFEEGRTFPVV